MSCTAWPQTSRAISLAKHFASDESRMLGRPFCTFEAARWISKSADQGNARAQRVLGSIYLEGRGVVRSEAEAISWYRRAAEQGDLTAQAALAFACSRGLGTPRDDAEAARWYRAGDAAPAAVQARLGSRFASGRHVPRDFEEAVMREDFGDGRPLGERGAPGRPRPRA